MNFVPSRYRTVVIDPYPLFRSGVVLALRASDTFDVIGEGDLASDAVRIATQSAPDVLLAGFGLAHGGAEAIRAISQAHPQVHTVVMTSSHEVDDVVTAMSLGVRGYILKQTSAAELIVALRAVVRGEQYLSPEFGPRLVASLSDVTRAKRPRNTDGLTSREHQIVAHVSDGATNKEIARRLSLTEKTVKFYMSRIMEKVGVRNRVELVLVYRAHAGAPPLNGTARPNGSSAG